jgi:hypothetical protein
LTLREVVWPRRRIFSERGKGWRQQSPTSQLHFDARGGLSRRWEANPVAPTRLGPARRFREAPRPTDQPVISATVSRLGQVKSPAIDLRRAPAPARYRLHGIRHGLCDRHHPLERRVPAPIIRRAELTTAHGTHASPEPSRPGFSCKQSPIIWGARLEGQVDRHLHTIGKLSSKNLIKYSRHLPMRGSGSDRGLLTGQVSEPASTTAKTPRRKPVQRSSNRILVCLPKG